MKKIALIGLLTFAFAFSQAQSKRAPKIQPADLAQIKSLEDTIGLLSFLVINDSIPEHRFAACRKLIPTLVEALKMPNSFQYKFPKINAISIQYPKDSSFRIFTWQLYVDVDDYRYYGAIQMNTSELKLFPLVDRSTSVEAEEFSILSPKQWLGVLYYNVRQFDQAEGRKYLLFGYDGYSFFDKRKVIDVLSFENGTPVFGAPVFISKDPQSEAQVIKNRIVKTYSAEAVFKLNYDPVYEVILFDHLQLMAGSAGQGPTLVPDGTYEAYELIKGYWMHIPKMFHQTQDEPPRDFPILDSPKRIDIFGKKGGDK